MTTTIESFQSSELSRNSAKVFAAAEASPVLVTRRDGADLVLMTQTESLTRNELLSLAAELLLITSEETGTLVERMRERFPWMNSLNSADQIQCTHDLISSSRAALQTQQPRFALAQFSAWKETASILEKDHHQSITEWLETPIEVARPE